MGFTHGLLERQGRFNSSFLQTKDNNYHIISNLFECRWLCGCPPTQEMQHLGKPLWFDPAAVVRVRHCGAPGRMNHRKEKINKWLHVVLGQNIFKVNSFVMQTKLFNWCRLIMFIVSHFGLTENFIFIYS